MPLKSRSAQLQNEARFGSAEKVTYPVIVTSLAARALTLRPEMLRRPTSGHQSVTVTVRAVSPQRLQEGGYTTLLCHTTVGGA